MTKKSEKYLLYTAENLTAVATHKGGVVMEVLMPDVGLMPNVTVAFQMSPDEARHVAQLLLQVANDAERKPS